MIDWEPFDGIIGGATVTRAQVVAVAQSWVGVPYHHQGDSRAGCDCGGLIKGVLMELGLLSPDYLSRLPPLARGYSRAPDGELLMKACGVAMQQVPIAQMQPADVLLIAWDRARKLPQHTAIVVPYRGAGDHLAVVHAIGPGHHNKVIETRIDDQLRKRIVGVYSLPGVV
jgi:cell wall-associated NlpC family hydrolase